MPTLKDPAAAAANVQFPKVPREIMERVGTATAPRISDSKWDELERWISDSLPKLISRRERNANKIKKWRMTLSGKRMRPAPRQDASNISVPLTLWAASAARARLDEGVHSDPLATIEPAPGTTERLSRLGFTAEQVATDLRTFFDQEYRNPYRLDALSQARKIIAETANYGTSALKVYIEEDQVRLVAPTGDQTEPEMFYVPGQPKWEYISYSDLIYWRGYGADTQRMPYVGHEFDTTWSDMTLKGSTGVYRKDPVRAVAAHYVEQEPQVEMPYALRKHPIAQLYLEYVVDDSIGLPVALMVDFHVRARKLLRVAYNQTPEGVRPIWITQFDENPDPREAEGQGVCEKLEGAQDETDAVHNIGIEAAKRAAAFLTALKFGSSAADELGGAPVLPGDKVTTENPKEDIVTVPLGDARAVQVASAVEDRSRLYVFRILGLDESRLGQVESGKRVPASLGLSIQREGRYPIAHALSSFGRVFTEAAYITFELYKQAVPEQALRAALPEQSANILLQTVFTTMAPRAREAFIINVHAQDAAASEEAKKQELVFLTQFLFGFYDKLVQYGQMAVGLPPELKAIMVSILSKLEKSVKTLLAHMESIQNPSDVVPEVAKMIEQLDSVGAQIAGQRRVAADDAGGATNVPDMGGGIT